MWHFKNKKYILVVEIDFWRRSARITGKNKIPNQVTQTMDHRILF
jgi:hypothetical protein